MFLFLIEFNSELNTKLNETDDAGRLPLDLALGLEEDGISRSLVEHKANLNQMNNEGNTLETPCYICPSEEETPSQLCSCWRPEPK